MQTYTLYELNEYIRRVLALNLPDAVWISCELAQVKESRGHFFLSLAQKDDSGDTLLAQAEAVLWQSSFRRLRRRLGRDIDDLLQPGLALRLQVRIDFNERYGLKLIIEDIDPAYTLGLLELTRRQTLERLRVQDLLERNRRQPLPHVLQRIALLSSTQAAGLQDYQQQLAQNAYGYQFRNRLFPVAVQGQQVEPEIIRQLKKIHRFQDNFDCVVIIRGGGSRLDLAAFDSYDLCRSVAECPLPVLTGIGHETDRTILDEVAHTSLKTPTAVAGFLIERNLHFESLLLESVHRLEREAARLLRQEDLRLHTLEKALHLYPPRLLNDTQRMLDFIANEVPRLTRYHLQDARREVNQLEKMKDLLSPGATLQRGFTLTLKDGRPVTSAGDLRPGDRIQTRFENGTADSEVIKNNPEEKN